jgi:hypothetical protein
MTRITDRQFRVGDRVTVSLSAGRVVDGVVKAVINRTDGVRRRSYIGGRSERRIARCFDSLLPKLTFSGFAFIISLKLDEKRG